MTDFSHYIQCIKESQTWSYRDVVEQFAHLFIYEKDDTKSIKQKKNFTRVRRDILIERIILALRPLLGLNIVSEIWINIYDKLIHPDTTVDELMILLTLNGFNINNLMPNIATGETMWKMLLYQSFANMNLPLVKYLKNEYIKLDPDVLQHDEIHRNGLPKSQFIDIFSTIVSSRINYKWELCYLLLNCTENTHDTSIYNPYIETCAQMLGFLTDNLYLYDECKELMRYLLRVYSILPRKYVKDYNMSSLIEKQSRESDKRESDKRESDKRESDTKDGEDS
jgi:hypothetical protein